MKLTAELNGVKIKKVIPTSWDQITFRQFIDLSKLGTDLTKIISYFLGIDEVTLKATKIKNLELIVSKLSFLNSDKGLIVEVPDNILKWPLPGKLELQSIERFEDIRKEVQGKQAIDILDSYPLIVATYAMPEYDGLKVDDFSQQFWEAPCGEVLAIGNFTLKKLSGLIPPSQKNYPLAVILLRRLRLAIRGWLANSAFSVRFYLWKKKHLSTGTKYSSGQ